tara:strand:+ start:3413 stop:3709 length:297 start_codon:yes stop_codon:yes gene_type:complete
MKSTPSTDHIIGDEDSNPPDTSNQEYIGATIVETISRDPLMQRVGIILGVKFELLGYFAWKEIADIYWQPSSAMPLTRPYRSFHILSELSEHYFIKEE